MCRCCHPSLDDLWELCDDIIEVLYHQNLQSSVLAELHVNPQVIMFSSHVHCQLWSVDIPQVAGELCQLKVIFT